MLLLLAPILALVTPSARAACTVTQTHAPNGLALDIAADGSCPEVSLVVDRAAALRAWTVEDGARRRLPAAQIVAHPWGVPALGWRVTAPGLRAGDHLLMQATWTPTDAEPHVDVRIDGSAPELARGGTAAQVWRYVADRHPEWGFTDPKFGRWERTSVWTFGPDGEAGWLDGLDATGGGGWWRGGAGTITVGSVEQPAAALGQVPLPPGALRVQVPNGVVVGSGEGADVAPTADGLTVQAPAGGTFRWRVASVGGVGVVADDVMFVAGVDAHYVARSLPEPAVPMALRGNPDRAALLQGLWDAVRAPAAARAADALHPRPLNAAWRSGWLTDAERTLVLLRFLGQEHIPARWVLTGAHPDPSTWAGYDHLLIAAQPADGPVLWLDPACADCALGQIDPALSGQPAVGGADHAPLLPGGLTLSATLGLDGVTTEVQATGEAARWVRAHVRPDHRDADLAALFGVAAPASVDVQEADGAMHIAFRSQRPPHPVDLPTFGG